MPVIHHKQKEEHRDTKYYTTKQTVDKALKATY